MICRRLAVVLGMELGLALDPEIGGIGLSLTGGD